MLITKKQNHIITNSDNATVLIDFEWFETNKRIQHKTARDGKTFRIKLLNEAPNFKQGDILHQENNTNYTINIIPCECLVIVPKTNFEMASICYEIGNKHLPLFYEDNKLLIPFEKPIFKLFLALGHTVFQARKVLSNPLKTTVSPHGSHSTLFSKIMNLTQK